MADPLIIKGIGHELAQAVADIAAAAHGGQHLHIGRELGQKLPARAAGVAIVLAVAVDGNAHKVAAALADGLAGGGALGADGAAEGSVFNVAAGKDRAVAALERRADGEMGIRHIGIAGGLLGQINQLTICHDPALLPFVWGLRTQYIYSRSS